MISEQGRIISRVRPRRNASFAVCSNAVIGGMEGITVPSECTTNSADFLRDLRDLGFAVAEADPKLKARRTLRARAEGAENHSVVAVAVDVPKRAPRPNI